VSETEPLSGAGGAEFGGEGAEFGGEGAEFGGELVGFFPGGAVKWPPRSASLK
jgi:hypothetical protein